MIRSRTNFLRNGIIILVSDKHTTAEGLQRAEYILIYRSSFDRALLMTEHIFLAHCSGALLFSASSEGCVNRTVPNLVGT